MIVLYHQIKISIGFWCRRRLNPKSLIQPSEILPVELTETHKYGATTFYILGLKLKEFTKINCMQRWEAI